MPGLSKAVPFFFGRDSSITCAGCTTFHNVFAILNIDEGTSICSAFRSGRKYEILRG